jgi:hypothetical protein
VGPNILLHRTIEDALQWTCASRRAIQALEDIVPKKAPRPTRLLLIPFWFSLCNYGGKRRYKIENGHIWTTLEDLTYHGGCQAHNSRVDSFVKSLSVSMQFMRYIVSALW